MRTCKEHATRKVSHLVPNMQDADKSKKPACRILIYSDSIGQAIAQFLSTFVVEPAATHVKRFNLTRRCQFLDRCEIAVANGEIITNELAKRRHRKRDAHQISASLRANIEVEPVLNDRKVKVVGAGRETNQNKMIFFEKIEDGNVALVLYLRGPANDGLFIERDFRNVLCISRH